MHNLAEFVTQLISSLYGISFLYSINKTFQTNDKFDYRKKLISSLKQKLNSNKQKNSYVINDWNIQMGNTKSVKVFSRIQIQIK